MSTNWESHLYVALSNLLNCEFTPTSYEDQLAWNDAKGVLDTYILWLESQAPPPSVPDWAYGDQREEHYRDSQFSLEDSISERYAGEQLDFDPPLHPDEGDI